MKQIKVGMTFIYGGAKHTVLRIVKDSIVTDRSVWCRGGVEVVLNNPDYYK